MGRKKQKVRWTSVEEGFFTNENEDVENTETKELSSANHSSIEPNPENSCPHKRMHRRSNKKPKYILREVSHDKISESLEEKSVTGCGSKDCNSCTCDMYCCCTTHEHTAICDDMPKNKNTSKTLKMDQANLESNNVENPAGFTETTVTNDCDTNSEHSSNTHSSYNNSNRSLNIQRMESFSSSGTGSREYERPPNHGERRYERKYHYNRDGSRRSYGGSDRGGGSTWINAPLAPRFERKAAIHAANAAANNNNYHSHHYGDQMGPNNGYDDASSMSMDMEELPNGFTKIRSKNLDVLFKKDYYAQRVHLNSGSSGAGTGAPVNSSSVSPNPALSTPNQTVEATDITQPADEIDDLSGDNKKDSFNNTETTQTNEVIDGATISANVDNIKSGLEARKKESSIASNAAVKDEDAQHETSIERSKSNRSNALNEVTTSLPLPESQICTSIEETSINNCTTDKVCAKQTNINVTEVSENCSNPLQEAQNRINTSAAPFYPRCQNPASSEQSISTEPSATTVSQDTISVQSKPYSSHTSSISSPQECSANSTPPTMAVVNGSKGPSLFLYSPSSNTIIPCEEIIIPNHPNVMQQQMSLIGKGVTSSELQNVQGLTLNQQSETQLESTCTMKNVEKNCNETEYVQNLPVNKNNVLTFPTSKVDTSVSRMPHATTGPIINIDTEKNCTGPTSPATPGMNGNAPAFVPRAQQQYFPTSLNIQHVTHPHTMIQYDQFGAPYTPFHGTTVTLPSQTTLSTGHIAHPAPGMPSLQHPVLSREYMPGTIQYHQQSSVLSNITVASSADMASGTSPTTPNGAVNSCSETSSAESSATIHSPADLSVYSPENWVSSPTQTAQIPGVVEHPRNNNMVLHPQIPLNKIEGSESVANGTKTSPLPQAEYQRSMSSPASYGNPTPHVSNVNGPMQYGPDGPLGYPQRSQYPPHFNSHVYYHPSAPSAHYISQGGSNLWYNLPQQQYYSMNGAQAFLGPQYQGYVNGYTSSGGGTNLQFMCESSTMPSSAGDSMAEDDPRDRSEEEIDIQNQSRTHVQNPRQSQSKLQLSAKHDLKQHLSTITEQDRLKSQKQNYARHAIPTNTTVLVSTNPNPVKFSSKKEDARDGVHGRDEGIRPIIPGLPAERLANKRVHKKRRKKKNISSDGLPAEQATYSTQSSIIAPDGHSGMSSLIPQPHQKGISINNIHRGSSSSEDLFSEGNMVRSDMKVSSTNASTNGNEQGLDLKDVRNVSNFSNSKASKGSKNIEIKGFDEGIQKDSNINEAFSTEQNPNPECLDSLISKSSGCDNEQASYQVCNSLAEQTPEATVPSLPTTSPSSPLQSINPSSSSIVISSSCLSSQEDDYNEKGTGPDKNQCTLRDEMGRGDTYDDCITKGNHRRDRSSSISSNEGINSRKEESLQISNAMSECTTTGPVTNTSHHDTHASYSATKEQAKTDFASHNSRENGVGELIKDTNLPLTKSKYADTLKKNAVTVRETGTVKNTDRLRNPNEFKTSNENIEKAEYQSLGSQIITKDGRTTSGSQSRQRNRRFNNNVKIASSNDNIHRNSNFRGSQDSNSTYKLQRSHSSQNPQFNGSVEDISNSGKKLYSKVACKASDMNTNIKSYSNKPQGFAKRGNAISKHESVSVKQDQYDKLDKQKEDNLFEGKDVNPVNMDGEIHRRNSADDVGWEMAISTHGGSKTRRNRKSNRSNYSTNAVQAPEPQRDSSASIKNKGQTEHKPSLDTPPTKAINQASECSEHTDEIQTAQNDCLEELENSSLEEKTKKASETTNDLTGSAANEEEKPKIETQTNILDEKATSSPTSKSSTLRRQRKKRSAQEPGSTVVTSGTTTSATSTIRPVLIQDGAIDIFGTGTSNILGTGNRCVASSVLKEKNALDIFDQTQIDDVVQKGHIDSLFVSEIGYGMIGGPISMGRFGTSKYTPPDRSEEILPMQELLKEKQKEAEDADAASKTTVIKVMMGEVQVSTAGDLAENTDRSGKLDNETNQRFQDVTDKLNERTVDTEQKPSDLKSNCNAAAQPVDLDLD